MRQRGGGQGRRRRRASWFVELKREREKANKIEDGCGGVLSCFIAGWKGSRCEQAMSRPIVRQPLKNHVLAGAALKKHVLAGASIQSLTF